MESNEMSEELVLYLIVRIDLKMGRGKIAAQCGHATQDLLLRCRSREALRDYICGASPKIVLKVNNEEEMDTIRKECRDLGLLTHQVIDVGRTQVPAGSKTVLGVGPVRKSIVPQSIKNLKLL